MIIVEAAKNPITLNEIFGFSKKKNTPNKDNKITSSSVNNNYKQEYEEYLARIPKLSSEEQSKYRNFINKMLSDMEKTLNKVLSKYPKVKNMFNILSLDMIMEYGYVENFNEFIYVYLNDESKKDSYVNLYNKDLVIGNFDIGYIIDDRLYSDKNSKSYSDIYKDILDDPEFQKQYSQVLDTNIESELSKLGYGKVNAYADRYEGDITISNITQSPKYKQYIK